MATSQRGLREKEGEKKKKKEKEKNPTYATNSTRPWGIRSHTFKPYLKVFRALRICSRQTPKGVQTEEKHYSKALSVCNAIFKSIPKPGIYLPCHIHLHLALPKLRKTVSNHTIFYVKHKSFSFHLPLNNK